MALYNIGNTTSETIWIINMECFIFIVVFAFRYTRQYVINVCERYQTHLTAYFSILTYGKHGRVHAMKSEQHDYGKRSSTPETQSESRQQVDEESSDVHYPMIYEFG